MGRLGPDLRVVALLVAVAAAGIALVVALKEDNRISQWVLPSGYGIGGVAYLAQSFETLLLGVGVDVGSDEETNDVEEGHPGVLREELLGKGQSQRGGDPADLHDGHEAGADGGADLVEGARTSNDRHGAQVDGVLDGGDLLERGC